MSLLDGESMCWKSWEASGQNRSDEWWASALGSGAWSLGLGRSEEDELKDQRNHQPVARPDALAIHPNHRRSPDCLGRMIYPRNSCPQYYAGVDRLQRRRSPWPLVLGQTQSQTGLASCVRRSSGTLGLGAGELDSTSAEPLLINGLMRRLLPLGGCCVDSYLDQLHHQAEDLLLMTRPSEVRQLLHFDDAASARE